MYDCVVCGREGGKEGKGVLQARHCDGTQKPPSKNEYLGLYIPSLFLFFDLGVRLGKHVVGTGEVYGEDGEREREREVNDRRVFFFTGCRTTAVAGRGSSCTEVGRNQLHRSNTKDIMIVHLQPDASLPDAEQLADQFAEVDARLGGVVERQLASVPLPFGVEDLHRQACVRKESNRQCRDSGESATGDQSALRKRNTHPSERPCCGRGRAP